MSVYSDKVKETLDLLRANPEWIDRYKGYAEAIKSNIEVLKGKKSSFHKWAPLFVYLTTSEMKKSGSTCFSLRYKGQEVGKLVVGDQITCYPSHANNIKNFGYDGSQLEKFAWNSYDARSFRSFFANKTDPRSDNGKRNEEHRLESLLLTYFDASEKNIEAFKHIRPISVIPGVRFPMPTPISASHKKAVTYSGTSGGGIDIFTRTGHGRATYLNIMELKDENHKGEEPEVVIRQAIAYATFILRLLRSESGTEWYKLFGFSSELPNTIKVYATCLMPKGYSEDKSFAGQKIYVNRIKDEAYDAEAENADIIEMHYMYFDEQDNNIVSAETSI